MRIDPKQLIDENIPGGLDGALTELMEGTVTKAHVSDMAQVVSILCRHIKECQEEMENLKSEINILKHSQNTLIESNELRKRERNLRAINSFISRNSPVPIFNSSGAS